MSDEDDTTIGDQTDAGTDRADDEEGADKLNDAGKQALDRMKIKWQAEKNERKARDDRIAELEAELAKTKPATGDKPADQVDAEAIRKQARAEARAEAMNDRALDRIEARAAKLFADPEDARLQLATKAKDFIDGDGIDTEAIDEALAELLKRKPHLAAQGGRRFEGSADQGSRKGTSRPAQLTKADLDRMSDEQIVAAKKAGQFDDLMSGKR